MEIQKNMNLDYKLLTPIKGDASNRKFYRKKKGNKSSIIIFCKKEKYKNLIIYESINRVLIKNKISAPKYISQNLKKDFIEIEDLGNKTIYEKLIKKKINKIYTYKKIIELLIKIQKIKTKKVKDIFSKNYFIPNYSKKVLFDEVSIFFKWYTPLFYKGAKKKKINNLLKNNIKKILENLKLPDNTFVHRDFHVSNLIHNKNRISVIDSQDVLYGNPSYDLASLVDDVRIETDIKIKNLIYNFYISKKKVNIKNFKNDFEILSVLRNLKIIGIFIRLAQRDQKKKYLKLIPHAWHLIKLRIEKNKNLIELKKNLKFYFPNKI